MTTSFALISEGITDQVFIKKLISQYYKGKDVEVNAIQPEADATDATKQSPGTHGGWENVLNYCTSYEQLELVVQYNDYIIIQVDTDQCHHVNFGVNRCPEGIEKPVDQIVSDVISVIKSKIPFNIQKNYGCKIFFAVAADSLECWIIPLHTESIQNTEFPKSCENKLNAILSRKNICYEKTYSSYAEITKKLSKKTIANCCTKNKSLDIFVKSLPNI